MDRQDLHRLSGAWKGEKDIYGERLKPAMVLSRDVMDAKGTLIVAKDTIITDVLKYQLINYFLSHIVDEPVYIESTF